MKKYRFNISHGVGDCHSYWKDENELTQNEKELLFGEAIHRFNELPDELKIKFFEKAFVLNDSDINRKREKYREIVKKFIDDFHDSLCNQLNKNKMDEKVVSIAKVCHQANKAWCQSNGDDSQKDWDAAEEWQRDSAIKGVEFRLNNPGAGKDAQHNAWMEDKVEAGWIYGEVKDAEAKTHPCIVPFDQLPEFQQKKDALFCAIVDSLK